SHVQGASTIGHPGDVSDADRIPDHTRRGAPLTTHDPCRALTTVTGNNSQTGHCAAIFIALAAATRGDRPKKRDSAKGEVRALGAMASTPAATEALRGLAWIRRVPGEVRGYSDGGCPSSRHYFYGIYCA
ncbi:unnamed protein product, partial [Ixodes persulcatus]